MDSKPLSFRPGEFFGPYRVLSELARGGQGLVLRAQHAQGALVALKILLQAEGPAFKRFQKEVAVLARLSHPNLPRILDTGMVYGRPFLAMQLVEGGSLAYRLKHRGPLPVEEAVEVLSQIADVLEYCHSLGVYHRDLKPGNIVVDQVSGRPFLVDFGILKHDKTDGALSLDGASRLSMTGEVVGTISYMAPEQGGDSDVSVTPATDVYGLAATLFDLWTGRPPFKGETAYNTLLAVIDQAPPDPRSLRPEVPARAAEVCLRGLAKLPEERPATPRIFLDELQAALSAPPNLPSEEGPSRTLWVVVGLVVVLVVFGAVGALIPVPGAGQVSLTPAESTSLSLTPSSPTPGPSSLPSESAPAATPTPPSQLPVSPAGSLTLRLSSPNQARPLVRCGPWLLMREVDHAQAFRVRDVGAGFVALPDKSWPFGWDARAGCLVFERGGESFRVAEDGGAVPSPYPTGFGLVELGRLRVAAFADGRLVAFDPAAPHPPAWTARAERNRALPLPLDLDRDGIPEHLLVCTRGGRALLIDAQGATRLDVALPMGVNQAPLLLDSSGSAPVVLVACSGGVVLRCRVSTEEFAELSRVDLLEPLRGPVAPVVVNGEVRAIAVVVQHAGLSVLDAQVQGVDWCGRRSVPGEVTLAGPAVVDLDQDGVPELALARFTGGPRSQAWVEVYRLDGAWVTRLPAGARDLRMAPGPAPLLIAAGKKGVWAWGPWEALPEVEGAPPLQERVFSNLLGGAWRPVVADCERLGGVEGKVYSTLAARHLGQPDLRSELPREDYERSMEAMRQIYQDTVSSWILHRLLAFPGHPRPGRPEAQPISPVLGPALKGRVGVEFKDEIVGHGIGMLQVANYDPNRKLLAEDSWIRFEWPTLEPGPKDLVVKQSVYNVKGSGYDEVHVILDGRPLGGLSCYFGERGELRLSLGEVPAGQHRIEIEIRRSSAVIRIFEIWIEPTPAR